ncbi:hypothetical protein [Nocardioides campestrisoli]|uniref:hypothetical protein n=1 Tax=Nocardioides campestrisoli TaxID=2736757 RepID=UPI0015E675AB|nr:hypothetical protein [Nocardioides campestrisoli]
MDSPVVRQELADKDVEVLWDDVWCWGVLKSWRLHEDGSWSAAVKFSAPDGTRYETFPADQVRPVEDESDGRADESS